MAPEFRQARSRQVTGGVLASLAMGTWCSKGALAALLLAYAGGCGSGSQTSDAGGDGDAGSDAPVSCGDAAPCTSAQVCVSQQSCGTSDCRPVPDAGTCPAGSSATASCPGTGRPGCLAGCPATFSCKSRPAACATAVDCTCAASLCMPGTCIATMENRVACEGL
jgi:hypothetical protein